MHFDLDPNEIIKDVLGPLGAFVLLLLIAAGFAWPKPWFYFAREVDDKEANFKKEIEQKDKTIDELNIRNRELERQNEVLLNIAHSGTAQGSQVAVLAQQLAEIATGGKIQTPGVS